MQMKVIVNGANGTMGKYVISTLQSGKYDAEAVALVSPSFTEGEKDKYPALREYQGEADCVIDFSNHAGVRDLLDYCVSRQLPVVIATTGHTPEELELIRQASEKTGVFFSANTSVGVAVLGDLIKRAAAAFTDMDIEIIERHHNRKADAPSGTALMLANQIKEVRENAEFVCGRNGHAKRQPNEIGIHAVRYGNEVGTHEIIFSNGLETVTIKHEAENRSLFADGAVKAAFFVCGKPAGFYGMKDLLA